MGCPTHRPSFMLKGCSGTERAIGYSSFLPLGLGQNMQQQEQQPLTMTGSCLDRTQGKLKGWTWVPSREKAMPRGATDPTAWTRLLCGPSIFTAHT